MKQLWASSIAPRKVKSHRSLYLNAVIEAFQYPYLGISIHFLGIFNTLVYKIIIYTSLKFSVTWASSVHESLERWVELFKLSVEIKLRCLDVHFKDRLVEKQVIPRLLLHPQCGIKITCNTEINCLATLFSGGPRI